MSINNFFRLKQILYTIIIFLGGFLLSLIINSIINNKQTGNIYLISLIIFLILILLYFVTNYIYVKKFLLYKLNSNNNNNIDESESRRKFSIITRSNDKRVSGKDRRINKITYNFNNVNILIIETNLIELKFLQEHLTLQGINIDTCTSGKEAIKKIFLNIPDLILLDIMLPHHNGFEIVKKIRKNYSKEELPILFLTEKNKIRDIETGFWVGANDYIIKPYSAKELLTRINFHISFKNNIIHSKKLLLLQNDIKIAQKIHLQSIPGEIPNLKNYKISARYQPMNEIGGDYYDLKVFDENNIGIFLSDVSGHGIPASLIAAMIKIVVMMQKKTASKPADFLEEMNNMLIYNIADQFVTASYIYIDHSKKELLYARAGHEPLIILNKKNKKIKKYQPKGRAIGWYDKLNCKIEKINITADDRIICYSDGIINTVNKDNKFFGINNFIKNIIENSASSPEIFIDNLFKTLNNWTGKADEPADDITIIVTDINL